MSALAVTCPCGAKFEFSPGECGLVVVCEKCNQPLTLPARGELRRQQTDYLESGTNSPQARNDTAKGFTSALGIGARKFFSSLSDLTEGLVVLLALPFFVAAFWAHYILESDAWIWGLASLLLAFLLAVAIAASRASRYVRAHQRFWRVLRDGLGEDEPGFSGVLQVANDFDTSGNLVLVRISADGECGQVVYDGHHYRMAMGSTTTEHGDANSVATQLCQLGGPQIEGRRSRVGITTTTSVTDVPVRRSRSEKEGVGFQVVVFGIYVAGIAIAVMSYHIRQSAKDLESKKAATARREAANEAIFISGIQEEMSGAWQATLSGSWGSQPGVRSQGPRTSIIEIRKNRITIDGMSYPLEWFMASREIRPNPDLRPDDPHEPVFVGSGGKVPHIRWQTDIVVQSKFVSYTYQLEKDGDEWRLTRVNLVGLPELTEPRTLWLSPHER